MTTFGKLLAEALGEQRARGDVFWVANSVWQLSLYEKAKALHHPGLICSSRPSLAPGTSQARAGKGTWGMPFSLEHPESLNSKANSTFFLKLRKHIPVSEFGHLVGRIHETDLQRLNLLLGSSNEGSNAAR